MTENRGTRHCEPDVRRVRQSVGDSHALLQTFFAAPRNEVLYEVSLSNKSSEVRHAESQ